MAGLYPDQMDPHLDAAGYPERPLIAVDTDGDRCDVTWAIEHLRDCTAIVVALTRSTQLFAPVAAMADVCLTAVGRARSRAAAVDIADPVAAVHRLQARVACAPRAALTSPGCSVAAHDPGVRQSSSAPPPTAAC